MKKLKLFAFILLFISATFFFIACDEPVEEEEVDYDAVLEAALDEVKIPGVATVANRDFTVPLSVKVTYEDKEYTVTLSWTSSDSDVISLDGAAATVTRPAIGSGDASVTLTCTLSLEDKTKEKRFDLTVYEAELTTKEILDEAERLLEEALDELGYTAITEDIALPLVAGLASVSWVSTDINVITSTGNVKRPVYGSGNATVAMVATLRSGADSRDVTFNFVVLEGEKPDDSELPILAASFLVIQTENVVDDLELPVTGRFDTTITWESSNEDIIASDGTVTRPAAATGNPVKVMLTATITYGDFSAVKTFIVNVLELEPQDNQEIANIAFNSLRLDYVLVTDNELVLPFEGAFDAVFTFETDNANVVVDENVLSVNRLSQDYYVKVKATTVIDEQSYDFYFGFVVKAAAKGSGTLEDPFVIETAEDLAKVGTGTDGWTLDAHYALFNDIDMSTICGEELGTFAGIGSASDPFTGTFNGNGYTVSNLYMNLPEQERVGLFNAAVKAEIKNFHLKDAVVIGKAKVGSVAGFINSCTVTNVFAENVKVTGTYIGDAQTGGFIGFVENVFENDDTPAIISNCGAVNVEVTGQWHVGGLIGRATNNPYNANDDGYHIYVKDVFVSGVVIANRRQGGLIGSFTGWLENAVSDVVLKLHPSPANTQNSCGLILGAIEYKSSGTPATYIKNVVGSGDMTEIIENKTGRTASFVPYYGTPLDKITIEDVYITIEPYLKNGTSDYNEGFAGVQITMENATSYNWYYGTLKTFDFINTWEIKEGELPTVKYVDDRSLVRYALEVFFDIPEEVDSDLVLVKDTLIQGVEIVWSSDNEAIAADGAVTRPAFVDGDATVRLTAKYVVNGVEYTKEFDVLVKCEEPTEDEKFAVVKGELEEALGEERTITADLELITAGSYDAEITWTSNNEAISATGAVTRPEAGSGDANVKLTAVVKIGESSRTYEYDFVVLEMPNHEKAVNDVFEELVLPETVTEDLTFDTSVESNNLTVNIAWSSDNEDLISTNGVVTRPSYLAGDKSVTITAVITCGEFSLEKVFEVVVVALPATDDDMITEAENALKESVPAELAEDVVLPTLNEGVSVEYVVLEGAPYVVIENGRIKVTKPDYETGDVEFVIEATISFGAASRKVTITGHVLKMMGDGSAENPFVIDSLELLEKIGSGIYTKKSSYVLKADIDMGEKYNGESGLSWTPIADFEGSFDGGNHTISNLYINDTNATFQGLFGRLASFVTIKNLKVVNADITAKQTAGILGGQINADSREVLIENIYVQGRVECINGTGDTVNGGLFGAIDARSNGKDPSVTINNIYIDAEIIGCQNVGGFSGSLKANNGTKFAVITNVEVRGTVTGNQKVGGFIGQIERIGTGAAVGNEEYITIQNCVSYADVSFNESNDKVPQANGGFVGLLSDGNTAVTVNFVSCIHYGAVAVETFTEGYRSSFVGRSNNAAGTEYVDCYCVSEPFAFNGSNPTTSNVYMGEQLASEDLLSPSFYEELGFSDEIWEIGASGIVLKHIQG